MLAIGNCTCAGLCRRRRFGIQQIDLFSESTMEPKHDPGGKVRLAVAQGVKCVAHCSVVRGAATAIDWSERGTNRSRM